jgi:hypothetical protein
MSYRNPCLQISIAARFSTCGTANPGCPPLTQVSLLLQLLPLSALVIHDDRHYIAAPLALDHGQSSGLVTSLAVTGFRST